MFGEIGTIGVVAFKHKKMREWCADTTHADSDSERMFLFDEEISQETVRNLKWRQYQIKRAKSVRPIVSTQRDMNDTRDKEYSAPRSKHGKNSVRIAPRKELKTFERRGECELCAREYRTKFCARVYF